MIILAADRPHLNKIRDGVSTEFTQEIADKSLLFLTVDELMDFLDSIKAKSLTAKKTIAGYTVKTTFTVLDEVEAKIREESLAKVVLG